MLSDYLSMKIGKKLQEYIFEEVQQIKSKYLWLSVLKTNERAISFYKLIGFEHIGEHTFDIGKEHFVYCAMKKDFY